MFHSTMIMVAIALIAAPVGGAEQVPEAAVRARPVQPPDCGACSRDLQAVRAEIERHLQTMRTTRLTLAAQTSVLDERIRQQEVFSDHSRQVAEQIRMRYQQARQRDRFPIEVRGVAFTQAQARDEVALRLTESASYDASLILLRRAQQEAQRHRHDLALKINAAENLLVALLVEEGLAEARIVSDNGDTLLAAAEAMLDGAAHTAEMNPIRTVRELLATANSIRPSPVTAEEVDAYLQETPAAAGPIVPEMGDEQPTVYQPPTPQDVASSTDRTQRRAKKPFQQF